MRILSGVEARRAMRSVLKAGEVASKSGCGRAKCGSIIVNNGKIIGEGFNSSAGGEDKRCGVSKADFDLKVTDKTCCVHAEQRAIMNALSRNGDRIVGSRLYFARLDKEGEVSFAGDPYCTICSKMALDVGISEFVLFREEGICVFDTKEYNDLSFEYMSG
ncbi:hypothetical protein HN903_00145 [archaeon]|mgnify:CR=1 FL=1|jgi:deoxycytidylate deaminase|nr:hypothetical protein [archaeon]MBT7128147.1 hypothetical protein [archaeon]